MELLVWGRGGRGWAMGRDSWGVWDGHVHTAIFKIGSQQGPTGTGNTGAQGTLLNVM